MASCQNDGPFLGPLNNRCRIIIGTQKGTTTHILYYAVSYCTILYPGLLRGDDIIGLGFWALGFRGLGFRCLGFRALGFRV